MRVMKGHSPYFRYFVNDVITFSSGIYRKQQMTLSFVFPAVVSEAQKWPQEIQLVL